MELEHKELTMRRRGSFHPGCVIALIVLTIAAIAVSNKVKDLTESRGLAILSGLALAYSPFLVILTMALLGGLVLRMGLLSWIERLAHHLDERFYARLKVEEQQSLRQRRQRAKERRRHREMKRRRDCRRRTFQAD